MLACNMYGIAFLNRKYIICLVICELTNVLIVRTTLELQLFVTEIVISDTHVDKNSTNIVS